MAEYVFQNQDNIEWELLQPGEYQFKILDVDEKISKGAKTAGCPQLDIVVAVGDSSGIRAQWTEVITIHPKTSWKVDTLLKSVGFFDDPNQSAGQKVELNKDTLIGRRGFAKIKNETYTVNGCEERTTNRVATWLTDKKKLGRDMSLVPATAQAESEDAPF